MAPRRARKQPITSSLKSSSISHKQTQATISSFHTLLKRRATLLRQLAQTSDSKRDEVEKEIREVESQISDLGGIDAYQHASTLGQSSERGGDSSKVLIGWLRELHRDKTKTPLRMLEIGALKPNNYSSCSTWIHNSPMDLNSRHPDIEEGDFLQRAVPTTDDLLFDIVSCSLVLNFVPDPKDRGRMLRLCRAQLRQSPSSLLFMVLPTPCVNNSRYMTLDAFKGLVHALGFRLLREKSRPGGKVSYWLWQFEADVSADVSEWQTKRLRNDGPKRNNFAVLV